MRAVLTSFGTAGCTQPVLALAEELRRGGHYPVVALPSRYSSRAKQLGIECVPLGADFADGKEVEHGLFLGLISDPNNFDSIEHMSSLGAVMARALPQVFDQLSAACSNADMLISKASMPVSRMIHELTDIPFVAFHTFYLPGSNTRLGDEGTPAYQKVTEQYVNQFRRRLGLPSVSNPMTRNGDSGQMTLYAISRHIVPRPAGWPAHYHMPGYFFLDEDSWDASPELVRFIDRGQPPIVISFGSMVHTDPDVVTLVLLEAVRAAGCRAIIQRGSSGLGRRDLGPNVIAVDHVPHSWLFPRASGVVHHGGSGTTAAALRAGVPSIVVPHTYDQPIWAEILEGLGCAGPSIPFSNLTVERLAWSIAKTLTTPSLNVAARAVSRRIQSENGVQTARQLIEGLANTGCASVPINVQ
jgi:UDP:flavonoid glycosyltransferase YjiC (YdhE family)